jgi:predicted transcriptional regulator
MSTSISTEEVARRRDRHDIIVEILKTALNGKVKTHIMYKARLSYAQLNEYLPRLVENGFLENLKVKRRTDYKRVFRTTQKGIKFIENFENMRSLWSLTEDSSEEQAF